MTHKQIYELLQEMQLPVVYHHFNGPQEPPYLIYLTEDSISFGADNKVYYNEPNWVIELYTNKKDLEVEEKLEALLKGAEIFYEKHEAYIDSEKLYQVRYEL